MSSSESNLSNDQSPPPAGKKPQSSVGLVVGSIVLLAALVWAMAPGRAKFTPASLRPVPPGCPPAVSDFVPTDATEVPGVDLSSLTPAQRNHVLYRLNMEPCPCSCNTSIAACRINHPQCPLCKDLITKIVAEETAPPSQNPEAKGQEPETKTGSK